jgi:hypothetical protein
MVGKSPRFSYGWEIDSRENYARERFVREKDVVPTFLDGLPSHIILFFLMLVDLTDVCHLLTKQYI